MRYIFFFFGALIMLLPQASDAYFTTEQTATKLTDNVALFTVTYGFQSDSRTFRLPVIGMENPTDTQFGYQILTDDEPYATYTTSLGFVYADLPIVDGMYELTPGNSAEFTAVVLVILPEERELQELSVHIDALPLYKGEERKPLPLNVHQLQYYKTPEVSI